MALRNRIPDSRAGRNGGVQVTLIDTGYAARKLFFQWQ